MNARLIELSNMMASYSMGNFDYKVELSSKLDEIDSIISGVNMLGEELRETTVSRNFFSSIYDAVSNVLFVIDSNGIITDVNKTVYDKLGYKSDEIIKQSISIIFSKDNKWGFELIKNTLSDTQNSIHFEAEFISKDNKLLYNSCACSKIIDQSNEFKGYLIIAEDITEKKETEKLLVRTILDTQEKERKRVADDLHDSLGQELSVIRLMLDSTNKNLDQKATSEIINNCIEILDTSITSVRSICFDLMPHVLQFSTIIEALKALTKTIPINFVIECKEKELDFPKEKELMIFRVCQEFISNTLKYAEADLIKIIIEKTPELFIIKISDNGKGFEIGNTTRTGRGSNTMRTRVESFEGKYKLESKLNEGTLLTITFKR